MYMQKYTRLTTRHHHKLEFCRHPKLRHTATHCSTLQHVHIQTYMMDYQTTRLVPVLKTSVTATQYNTPQIPATHCNTLPHIYVHIYMTDHTASRQVRVQQTPKIAIHRNTLQHSAKLCNALRHTATHTYTRIHN